MWGYIVQTNGTLFIESASAGRTLIAAGDLIEVQAAGRYQRFQVDELVGTNIPIVISQGGMIQSTQDFAAYCSRRSARARRLGHNPQHEQRGNSRSNLPTPLSPSALSCRG